MNLESVAHRMTGWLHVLIATALLASAGRSPAEPANKEPEPAPQVVASGKCHVPICYELDLKELRFRIYTANRASLYRYIPKGACSCASTTNDPGFFGLAASMTFETKDGGKIGNVAIGRARNESDINLRTTHERFLSEQDKFEPVTNFQYRGFDFSGYDVYRERQGRGSGNDCRRYYFIPTIPQYVAGGPAMKIAFNTPLCKSLNSSSDELVVATKIRLSDQIYVFQFFDPRNTPSAQWPTKAQETADLIELRLFPK